MLLLSGAGQRLPSADLQPLCASLAAGPVGNYGLISAIRRWPLRPAGEHPHNEELQMRGKAWLVSELPATAHPCLPETGCSRLAPTVFLAPLLCQAL